MMVYNTKIPAWSKDGQTEKINELTRLSNEHYGVDDIFNILPSKIEYNGKIGYLRISKFDITWSSLESETQGSIVLIFQYLLQSETIFDAFIKALTFINEKNVIILEK